MTQSTLLRLSQCWYWAPAWTPKAHMLQAVLTMICSVFPHQIKYLPEKTRVNPLTMKKRPAACSRRAFCLTYNIEGTTKSGGL